MFKQKARHAKAALSTTLKRHCLPNDFPPPLFSLIIHRLRKTSQRSEILPPHREISELVAGLVLLLFFLRAEFLSSSPRPVGPKSSKSVGCEKLNCIPQVQRDEHTEYRQARAGCQGLLVQRVLASVKAHKPYIILICHVNSWMSRSRFKSLLLLF
ncbi:hypothetical protein BGZ57DRAFT_454331 [Hyaloscypha finlandica]|nr:hypothetical protein BGZ57DRAFT_454331 [Hyaloscypha finlandica]KAH8800974.1 hypothetical protein F5882DRAFT_165843 [Hyaloscypha sp. PMI_1271]